MRVFTMPIPAASNLHNKVTKDRPSEYLDFEGVKRHPTTMESLKKFEIYSLGSSLHSLEHAFTDFARVGCKGSVRHHTWKQGTAIFGQRKLTIPNIIFINAICKSMKQRNGLHGHGHYQTDHVLLVNKQK